MGIVGHVLKLWGNWWLIPLSPLLFVCLIALVGDLRVEHVVAALAILVMAISTRQTRDFLWACMPGIAIGVGYELVRYTRPLIVREQHVWGCELEALEARLFAFDPDGSLTDQIAQHNSLFWDMFFALPYTFFWMITIAYAALLFFINRHRLKLFLWVLAGTHAVAFVVWHTFPAAPPWYVQIHGCDINLDALPNAAALLRLDAYFEMDYFENFYSRSPFVFGAVPSLHCSFPLAGLLASWRDSGWIERIGHLTYFLWMWVASVYLLHHWIFDGLLTLVLALLVYAILKRYFRSHFWPSPKQRNQL